ncbi:MAG: FAD-dependent oxidoreductase, partial [Desulfobacterales bacterium]|nr:FAD-dependent oxidoreductase [Desulfobacterales bacterium]
LLKPIRIKSLEIANRVVMPPMGTGLGNEDGTVSEANLAYLRRRVRSGAGLIITEISEVDPLGAVTPACLGIWDDTFIPGLKKMADVVHAAGSKIALQLHHCGRESLYQTKRRTAVAPSAIGSFIFGFIAPPREMTLDEIRDTIRAFGAGARRAKAAGFDMVELHGAHGYLLMQFLSAASNTRTDEYGGDFRGRARFMLECLGETRQQVGPDFPISIRISGEEGIQGGYTIDDMLTIVPDLVREGADLIHVSFGTHGNAKVYTDAPNPSAPIEYAPGFKTVLARRIKEVAGVPVITVGRFTDPYAMDEAVARGDADLVAVGRQHLADPDFLTNAREGRPEETFECLACNQGCIEREALEGKPIRCAINCETGQELIYPTQTAEESRTVWVIGGGPAGLTAAYEAARLGHKVTLFEKEKQIGGQIRYAEKMPHKSAYGKWVRTLAARAQKKGVDLRTETEVTEAMLAQGRPEAVILAIGADKAACPAPGITMSVVCDAWQLLNGEVAPKENAVVIGGGLVGMETADYLSQKGIRNVTLVEMLAKPPVRPISAHGTMLHRRLATAGVRLMFNTKVQQIEEGAVIVSTDGAEKRLAPVGQVIVAVGVTPRQDLKEMLVRKHIRHFVVGDAQEPRRIIEATTEGAQAAWQI